MKRFLIAFLCVALLCALLTGCNPTDGIKTAVVKTENRFYREVAQMSADGTTLLVMTAENWSAEFPSSCMLISGGEERILNLPGLMLGALWIDNSKFMVVTEREGGSVNVGVYSAADLSELFSFAATGQPETGDLKAEDFAGCSYRNKTGEFILLFAKPEIAVCVFGDAGDFSKRFATDISGQRDSNAVRWIYQIVVTDDSGNIFLLADNPADGYEPLYGVPMRFIVNCETQAVIDTGALTDIAVSPEGLIYAVVYEGDAADGAWTLYRCTLGSSLQAAEKLVSYSDFSDLKFSDGGCLPLVSTESFTFLRDGRILFGPLKDMRAGESELVKLYAIDAEGAVSGGKPMEELGSYYDYPPVGIDSEGNAVFLVYAGE